MEKSLSEINKFNTREMTILGNLNSLWLQALVISLFVFISSCREIYDPETDGMENVLVIDGLVTDQPGLSNIRLFYIKNSSLEPLMNATVYLSDNHGLITPFKHSKYVFGQYLPSGTFAGEVGKYYTLNIETDKEVYQSDPQLILPAAKLDYVFPNHAYRDYIFPNSYGDYIRSREAGFNVYADIRGETGNPLRVRIAPTLLLLYSWTETLPGQPPPVITHFAWKKMKLSNTPDINLDRYNDGHDYLKNHLVSFIPSAKYSYQLKPEEFINKYIIIIRYFTLNNEAYSFHEKAHGQISSDNKLFDPIASQLPTNIKCKSNPGLVTAGFFEASSTRTETYMLNYYLAGNIFHFSKIDCLEDIPARGSVENQKPPFWQD